ncbi:MAG TPA: CAP domain-containing protein [Thermoanaerobaculia bacterium]
MKTLLAVVLFAVAPSLMAAEITRESVLAEMNKYRLAHRLPPLRSEVRLTNASDDRMRDMEELAYWSHVSPDGRAPFVWMKHRGYEFQFAGENLASGFETVEVLVQSWMESEGHRANILSPSYQEVGISIIEGSTLGRATGKSIVVLFGRLLFEETQTARK